MHLNFCTNSFFWKFHWNNCANVLLKYAMPPINEFLASRAYMRGTSSNRKLHSVVPNHRSLALRAPLHAVLSRLSSQHWSWGMFPWPLSHRQLMAEVQRQFPSLLWILKMRVLISRALLVDQVAWSLNSFHPSSWSTEIEPSFSSLMSS